MSDVKKTKKKKTIRKDKLKSRAKVIKSRLKNPLKTTREVEKETGLDHTTVSRRDKELQQSATKDDRIIGICEEDINIVRLGQSIIRRRLSQIAKNIENPEEDIKASDISNIIRENTKRYSMFMGDRTDEKGGEKIISINDLYDKEE